MDKPCSSLNDACLCSWRSCWSGCHFCNRQHAADAERDRRVVSVGASLGHTVTRRVASNILPEWLDSLKLATVATLRAEGLGFYGADVDRKALWLFPAGWYERLPEGYMVSNPIGVRTHFSRGGLFTQPANPGETHLEYGIIHAHGAGLKALFEENDDAYVEEPISPQRLNYLSIAPHHILRAHGLRKSDYRAAPPNLWLLPGHWYSQLPERYWFMGIEGRAVYFRSGVTSDDTVDGMLRFGILNNHKAEK